MKKLFALLLITPLGLSACGEQRDTALDAFAMCLDEAGAEFYGAYWCPNCQRQEELFGPSMDYINYIECAEGPADSQYEKCLLEGIEAYPTWRFDNGNELVGYQGLEALSKASACALPGKESVMLQPNTK